MQKKKVSIFWFRRDLRIEDNHGLYEALTSSFPVLPIFIFDTNILDELNPDDARVSFIHDQLVKLNEIFKTHSSGLYTMIGKPGNAIEKITNEYDVQGVYFNEDYEPYGLERDQKIQCFLSDAGIKANAYKDHVIHAKNEILKADQTPYTIYTPYKNKWMEKFSNSSLTFFESEKLVNYHQCKFDIPDLQQIGFSKSTIDVSAFNLKDIESYESIRNFPALAKTSHLSPHLRFGTVSLRKVASTVTNNQAFLNQLIWRDFFIQILYHFPRVVHSNFKRKYDNIIWINNKEDFEKWKNGQTGYPIVDAGMRELNATGNMHNRVRMITASFFCKHLLIDWKWGEAYFAQKLLDYELALNNGNWQWSAGTGCDAAPYFRIFNPTEQVKKFDKDLAYIKKWVPELDGLNYPLPMIDHKYARARALEAYKKGIKESL